MQISVWIYHAKRYYHLLKTGLLRGLTAQLRYGFPAKKLRIIAITGTDGKTTTTTMLYHYLKTAGYKVALLSTVAAYVGDDAIDTGFHITAPQPDQLQAFMKRMVTQGVEYLVLETTSHGLYQYRTWGIHPELAAITNITHEHLDYHPTYEEYVKAKAILLKKSKKAYLNKVDQSFSLLQKILKKSKTKVIPYEPTDTIYHLVQKAINDRFPETYNRLNAKLAYWLAKELGIDNKTLITAVQTFPGVPGRMEEVKTNKKFTVIIDFAHTPNSLTQVLSNLRQRLNAQPKGKLIAVVGSAGLRDRSKRPLMGQAAANLADLAIFTAEDPRTEDVWSIIRQMKEGVDGSFEKIISIPDRRNAIAFALTQVAKPGDIVGIFGKGHEKSLCYGTVEYPWDERSIVREILGE